MSLPDANDSSAVVNHYAATSLRTRIGDALELAGLAGLAGDHDLINWKDLAPLDEFHVRGLAASEELAAGLQLAPGATVLDVGSGLGGPSRFLAATYGVHVTGIDLSPPFVEAATMLSERTGLSDRTTFQVADALTLPFEDSSFDHAWTQHVAMNIRDRARLYAEVFRVLEPGGSFAIYDVIRGDGESLIFPVPWARDPDISFLLTSDAMRDVLVRTGFDVVSWTDTTAVANEWIAKQRDAQSRAPSSPAIGLHLVTPPDFAVMMANLGRNLIERRALLLQAIVRRPM
ncbi:MAG TPA: methyltransferase domain-containing protein [Gemmatimonadaceae bacterium]|nr:methyltransferase domain-containing protein [Gemmatimonadaceae bacterium]